MSIVSISPYDDGISGYVIDLSGAGTPCSIGTQSSGAHTAEVGCTTYTTSGSGSGGGGLDNSTTSTVCPCVLLQWHYSSIEDSPMRFKIYLQNDNVASSTVDIPGTTSSNWVLIKTIATPSARNTALKWDTSGRYAFLDNRKTGIPAPLKYKIIGEHADGTTSEWSAIVGVE